MSPPRSSSLLDAQDPIAMHLLMETALGDSKGYRILPYDELEELKQERAALASRVDATARKLALESKLRDAAQSLNRLYTTKGGRDSGGGKHKKSTNPPPQ